jgi:hypothetical protein
MLIFGTNEKRLTTEAVTDKCLHCNKANVINLSVYQRYGHLFYIPFFPLKKTAVSICSHCKEKLLLNEMTSSLKEDFLRIKSHTRTPWWTFIGSVILIGLIINEQVNDQKKRTSSGGYFNSPKAGDFYEIKTPDDLYTLYRVESITKDSICFTFSKNEYFSQLKLSEEECQQPGNFTSKVYSISRNELKRMFDKETIVDIDRR